MLKLNLIRLSAGGLNSTTLGFETNSRYLYIVVNEHETLTSYNKQVCLK